MSEVWNNLLITFRPCPHVGYFCIMRYSLSRKLNILSKQCRRYWRLDYRICIAGEQKNHSSILKYLLMEKLAGQSIYCGKKDPQMSYRRCTFQRWLIRIIKPYKVIGVNCQMNETYFCASEITSKMKEPSWGKEWHLSFIVFPFRTEHKRYLSQSLAWGKILC